MPPVQFLSLFDLEINIFHLAVNQDGVVLGVTRTPLEIFNINGQKVRTLVDEIKPAGEHSVIWDSEDDEGGKAASGIYLYKIKAGEFIDSKKMTLTK